MIGHDTFDFIYCDCVLTINYKFKDLDSIQRDQKQAASNKNVTEVR